MTVLQYNNDHTCKPTVTGMLHAINKNKAETKLTADTIR